LFVLFSLQFSLFFKFFLLLQLCDTQFSLLVLFSSEHRRHVRIAHFQGRLGNGSQSKPRGSWHDAARIVIVGRVVFIFPSHATQQGGTKLGYRYFFVGFFVGLIGKFFQITIELFLGTVALFMGLL